MKSNYIGTIRNPTFKKVRILNSQILDPYRIRIHTVLSSSLIHYFTHFQNLSIATVGKDKNFAIFEDDTVSTYLELIAGEKAPAAPAAPEGEADEPAAGMETD